MTLFRMLRNTSQNVRTSTVAHESVASSRFWKSCVKLTSRYGGEMSWQAYSKYRVKCSWWKWETDVLVTFCSGEKIIHGVMTSVCGAQKPWSRWYCSTDDRKNQSASSTSYTIWMTLWIDSYLWHSSVTWTNKAYQFSRSNSCLFSWIQFFVSDLNIISAKSNDQLNVYTLRSWHRIILIICNGSATYVKSNKGTLTIFELMHLFCKK